MVTLTAMLSNLGHLSRDSNGKLASYAQIFLLINGKLQSLDHYMLAKHGEVVDLKVELQMKMGDTLQTFVGHHQDSRGMYGGSGRAETIYGFNLEQIRFCVFDPMAT